MGYPTDPIMRVATSGTVANGKHYSNDPATAGLVLTSTGPDTVPTWGPCGSVDVNRVYFVDAAGATAGQDGSLSHPFQDPQDAVDAIQTAAINDAVIMIAPGTYGNPLTVGPSVPLDNLIIQGWAEVFPLVLPADLPSLAGLITISEGIAVGFARLVVNSASITSPVPATDDLTVSFSNAQCHANLLGDNVLASFVQTNMTGDITGTTTAAIETDGFTWSTMVTQQITITPADYDRQFFDTGADTGPGPISAQGVAIGDTAICPVVYAGARPNEFAIACMSLPVAADYTVSFSHTDTDLVYFRLTNDSRVSTNFNEPCRIVVFHSDMSNIPVP